MVQERERRGGEEQAQEGHVNDDRGGDAVAAELRGRDRALTALMVAALSAREVDRLLDTATAFVAAGMRGLGADRAGGS